MRWYDHFGDPPSGSSIAKWFTFYIGRADHRSDIFGESASLIGNASMRFGELKLYRLLVAPEGPGHRSEIFGKAHAVWRSTEWFGDNSQASLWAS
ncbi:hypothetical protein H5410_036554 [Solanum commersonii]|uniref:Uncharacterized protein n=1 Tax=Solanum commersonii TaxID=4109 RepID=A0A9J5Y5M1_SOLCO|nr:hypothetical protein H5410_036554 [Solanum commersonii]